MNIYKRSLFVMLKNIISAPCAGAVLAIILNFFVENLYILIGVPVFVTLLILYTSIFSSRIQFTLSNTGEFCYYKKGKLKGQYDLTKCGLGYNRKTDGEYINLSIVTETGENVLIDAEPLGSSRFMKMFEDMQRFIPADEVMHAK